MKPSTLREELELELSYLEETVDAVHGLLERTEDRDADIYDRAAASMFMAQFYNGVENILKRICTYHGVEMPPGERSHAQLFELFCHPPQSPLPVLFPNSTEADFVILRRFRHFVRHSYAVQVDWYRLQLGMEALEGNLEVFTRQITDYLATVSGEQG